VSAGRNVCVVGAGIVGSATAYALAQDGWKVTLVDAQAGPGQGASGANGGQLSYSYVEPLATPEALQSLPGWLLSADSPLRWQPRLEWSHLRWLMHFVGACRWSEVHSTTGALLKLAGLSRTVLHQWLATVPASTRSALHFQQSGKLVVYRHVGALQKVQRQLAWQRDMGCVQQLVDRDACLRLEPALAATGGGDIAFGVWTDSEEVVDTRLLAEWLAKGSGATTVYGHAVQGFDVQRGKLQALRLMGGNVIAAEHFVVATGPGTGQLLAPLGLRLPIEPIKGYSVSLPVLNASHAPRVSITDAARKLVYAPLGDRLRVAGFAELGGWDLSIRESRIDALCNAVKETFPGACSFDDPQPWAGLRPATPSGRPLVGASRRWSNLWVNAGHGALGLTLAPGSAALLARMMGDAPLPIDATPFALP